MTHRKDATRDITIPMAPTKVTQDELDYLERVAGKDSPVYRRLAEQRQVYKEGEQMRLRRERAVRLAVEAQAREAAAAARRREAQRAQPLPIAAPSGHVVSSHQR